MMLLVSLILCWIGRRRALVSGGSGTELGPYLICSIMSAQEWLKLLHIPQKLACVRTPGSFNLMSESLFFNASVCWMTTPHPLISPFQC